MAKRRGVGDSVQGRGAWRRRDRPDPARRVLDELMRRELRDLDMCRQVWEHEGDPVALLEAIRLCEGRPLPEWLASSLLVVLQGSGAAGNLIDVAWRNRDSHQDNRSRAWRVVEARVEKNLKWADAFELGAAAPSSPVNNAEWCYNLVRKALTQFPFRYFMPSRRLVDRVDDARTYVTLISQRWPWNHLPLRR